MKRPLPVLLVLALGVLLVSLSLAGTATAQTVWLCKPSTAKDPCTPGLSTTVYSPSGKVLAVRHPKQVRHPAIDCFYVYPTVSDQTTGNSNLQVDPEERSIALYQAARYSQYCRVYAPMYRQITLAGIGIGHPTTAPSAQLAFSDVEAAFNEYLRDYNHGRGFVLIGHSQGSFELEQLIAKDVDQKPVVRHRLVSAIILGGNVLVKGNSGIGGDFKHIRACRRATQLGCVIAFSTFDQTPPSNSFFGHPVSLLGAAPPAPGDVVLCTNPAALGGGPGLLDPTFPSAPFAPRTLIAAGIALLNVKPPMPPTVWWTAPGAYSARCVTDNGANVLLITPLDGAPTPTPSPTPQWGLHLMDANIGLGNLIAIVSRQATAWARTHSHVRKR